jgi:hypothetical protein
MAEQNLDDEYAQIVLTRRNRGEISEPPQGKERRSFPRLIVDTPDIWIDSPSGAALMCNHPIELGTDLQIMSKQGKPVQVKVVACEIDESPTEFLDAQYRVHCKFQSPNAGMALVVESHKKKQ